MLARRLTMAMALACDFACTPNGSRGSPIEDMTVDANAATMDATFSTDGGVAFAANDGATFSMDGGPNSTPMNDASDGEAGVIVGSRSSITLPPLPATDKTLARRWASIPGITSVAGVQSRGTVVYAAANPEPLRIDWQNLSYAKLGRPNDVAERTQAIVAPAGGTRIVVVFAALSGARAIWFSLDDGITWYPSTDAGAPSGPAPGNPSALVSYPDSVNGPGRTFLLYGGTTLEVSDDGARTWKRVIPGASTPAIGVAIDTAGTNLWCVTEAVVDRVASYGLAITPWASPGFVDSRTMLLFSPIAERVA